VIFITKKIIRNFKEWKQNKR